LGQSQRNKGKLGPRALMPSTWTS